MLMQDILDDIVSDDGINSEAAISCYDQMKKFGKKMCYLLPKCTITLNGIRKCIALWSTAFMVDCKLSDGGHFGAECTSNVRVIPIDEFTTIHQDGKIIKPWMYRYNFKDCFLPYCSAIHPSRLDRNKIKNRDVYEKCFDDQCETATCDKAPSEAKCAMNTRSAIDIEDWCIPKWHDPNRSILAINYVEQWKHIELQRQWKTLLTYSFDCESGKEWYVNENVCFCIL